MNWDTECQQGLVSTVVGNIAGLRGFECIFKAVLGATTTLTVILLFVFLLIGGLKYMTSGGDPKASASASQTLTYAIAGLFLLVVIWLIMQFIKSFTGVDVTTFSIPRGN